MKRQVINGQPCHLATLVGYRCRCGMARTAEQGQGRPRCSDCGRTMQPSGARYQAWVVDRA